VDLIREIVKRYAEKELPPFSLQGDMPAIEEIFTSEKELKDVYAKLEQHRPKNEAFYKNTMAILNDSCPLSLRLIFEQNKKGSQLDYRANMEMDFRIVQKYQSLSI
jgi:Enoyl-CoA hydratase/isomerase